MATKLKTKDPLAFLENFTVDELTEAISGNVAELAREYRRLRFDREHPSPISNADKLLLSTERKDLTTVHLTQWRIAMREAAQDRLWHWYRTKSGSADLQR